MGFQTSTETLSDDAQKLSTRTKRKVKKSYNAANETITTDKPNETHIENGSCIKNQPEHPSEMLINGATDCSRPSLYCSVPLDKLSGIISALASKRKPVRKLSVSRDVSKNPNAESVPLKTVIKHLCLYCDRSFPSQKIQSKHIERVHVAPERRRLSARNSSASNEIFLGCPYCNRGKVPSLPVDELPVLLNHLIAEHNDKYYACVQCAVRFPTGDTLQRHTIELHSDDFEKKPERRSRNLRCSTESNRTSKKSTELDDETDDESDEPILRSSPRASKTALRVQRNVAAKKRQTLKTGETILSRLGITQNRSPRTRSAKNHGATSSIAEATAKIDSQNQLIKSIRSRPIRIKDPVSTVKEPIDFVAARSANKIETLSGTFDENFYQLVNLNVRLNLNFYIDGKIESGAIERNISSVNTVPAVVRTTLIKTSMVTDTEIHEATELNTLTAFPTLLTAQQYGADSLTSGKFKKPITKNSWKWKWDSVKKYKFVNEGGKMVKKIKHPSNGIRDLSKLDMWTQLTMRIKHEIVRKQELEMLGSDHGVTFDVIEMAREEKRKLIQQLNDILDSRILPSINLEQNDQRIIKIESLDDQLEHLSSPKPGSSRDVSTDNSESNILSMLNLFPRDRAIDTPSSDMVLSGEWARPRCYICFGCGAKYANVKLLEDHKLTQHPYVYSTHYEIVGKELLDGNLFHHFYIPSIALRRHSEYATRSPNNCLSIEDSMDSLTSYSQSRSDPYDTDSISRNSKISISTVATTSTFHEPDDGNLPASTHIDTEPIADGDGILCTKCKRKCSDTVDLYRHMLDCSADYLWMLAKKRQTIKYRYFGSKRRRSRRCVGFSKVIRSRKTDNSTSDSCTTTPKPKEQITPRPRPSDAESIQRMLANLPAKRACRQIFPNLSPKRKIISANSVVARRQKLMLKQKDSYRKRGLKLITSPQQTTTINRALRNRRIELSGEAPPSATSIRRTRSSVCLDRDEKPMSVSVESLMKPIKRKPKYLGKLLKRNTRSQVVIETSPLEIEKCSAEAVVVDVVKSNDLKQPENDNAIMDSKEILLEGSKTDRSEVVVEHPIAVEVTKQDVVTFEISKIVEEEIVETKKLTDSSIDDPAIHDQSTQIPTLTPIHIQSTNLVTSTPNTGHRRPRKLNDCIAMLTGKLQEKFGVQFLDEPSSILSTPRQEYNTSTLSNCFPIVQADDEPVDLSCKRTPNETSIILKPKRERKPRILTRCLKRTDNNLMNDSSVMLTQPNDNVLLRKETDDCIEKTKDSSLEHNSKKNEENRIINTQTIDLVREYDKISITIADKTTDISDLPLKDQKMLSQNSDISKMISESTPDCPKIIKPTTLLRKSISCSPVILPYVEIPLKQLEDNKIVSDTMNTASANKLTSITNEVVVENIVSSGKEKKSKSALRKNQRKVDVVTIEKSVVSTPQQTNSISVQQLLEPISSCIEKTVNQQPEEIPLKMFRKKKKLVISPENTVNLFNIIEEKQPEVIKTEQIVIGVAKLVEEERSDKSQTSITVINNDNQTSTEKISKPEKLSVKIKPASIELSGKPELNAISIEKLIDEEKTSIKPANQAVTKRITKPEKLSAKNKPQVKVFNLEKLVELQTSDKDMNKMETERTTKSGKPTAKNTPSATDLNIKQLVETTYVGQLIEEKETSDKPVSSSTTVKIVKPEKLAEKKIALKTNNKQVTVKKHAKIASESSEDEPLLYKLTKLKDLKEMPPTIDISDGTQPPIPVNSNMKAKKKHVNRRESVKKIVNSEAKKSKVSVKLRNQPIENLFDSSDDEFLPWNPESGTFCKVSDLSSAENLKNNSNSPITIQKATNQFIEHLDNNLDIHKEITTEINSVTEEDSTKINFSKEEECTTIADILAEEKTLITDPLTLNVLTTVDDSKIEENVVNDKHIVHSKLSGTSNILSRKPSKRKRMNELHKIIADQMLESFKEVDETRAAELKLLQELPTDDLITRNLTESPLPKRKTAILASVSLSDKPTNGRKAPIIQKNPKTDKKTKRGQKKILKGVGHHEADTQNVSLEKMNKGKDEIDKETDGQQDCDVKQNSVENTRKGQKKIDKEDGRQLIGAKEISKGKTKFEPEISTCEIPQPQKCNTTDSSVENMIDSQVLPLLRKPKLCIVRVQHEILDRKYKKILDKQLENSISDTEKPKSDCEVEMEAVKNIEIECPLQEDLSKDINKMSTNSVQQSSLTSKIVEKPISDHTPPSDADRMWPPKKPAPKANKSLKKAIKSDFLGGQSPMRAPFMSPRWEPSSVMEPIDKRLQSDIKVPFLPPATLPSPLTTKPFNENRPFEQIKLSKHKKSMILSKKKTNKQCADSLRRKRSKKTSDHKISIQDDDNGKKNGSIGQKKLFLRPSILSGNAFGNSVNIDRRSESENGDTIQSDTNGKDPMKVTEIPIAQLFVNERPPPYQPLIPKPMESLSFGFPLSERRLDRSISDSVSKIVHDLENDEDAMKIMKNRVNSFSTSPLLAGLCLLSNYPEPVMKTPSIPITEPVRKISEIVDQIRDTSDQTESDDDQCLAAFAKSVNQKILDDNEFNDDSVPVLDPSITNKNNDTIIDSETIVDLATDLIDQDENTNTELIDMDLEDDVSVCTGFTVNPSLRGTMKRKRRYKKSILLKSNKKTRKPDSVLSPVNFLCDICNKTFRSMNGLSMHKTTLTHISKLSEMEFLNSKSANKTADPVVDNACTETVSIVNCPKDVDNQSAIETESANNKSIDESEKMCEQPPVKSITSVDSPSEQQCPQNFSPHSVTQENVALSLSHEERLFYECCSMLKGSETLIKKPVTPRSNENYLDYLTSDGVTQKALTNRSPMTSSMFGGRPTIDNQFSDISCDSTNTYVVSQPPKSFQQFESDSAHFSSVSNLMSAKLMSFNKVNDVIPDGGDTYQAGALLSATSNGVDESMLLDFPLTNCMNRSPNESASQSLNSTPSRRSSVSSRVRTKAAMKGYENFKVSIPTTGLDLQQALDRSCMNSCKLAALADIALGTEVHHSIGIDTIASINNSTSSTVEKSQENCTESNIISTQLPSADKLESNKTKRKELSKVHINKQFPIQMNKDIYDFEDSSDYGNNPVMSMSAIRSHLSKSFTDLRLPDDGSPKITSQSHPLNTILPPNEDSQESSYSDRDDFNYGSVSESDSDDDDTQSIASSVDTSRKNLNVQKKCLIMGRIFKKKKDNEPVLKETTKSPPPKKDLDALFDNLRNKSDSKVAKSDLVLASSTRSCDNKKSESNTTVNMIDSSEIKSNENGTNRGDHSKSRKSRELKSLEAEWGMSMDQIKEIIGLGSRKTQRRCAINKHRTFAETWSSDEYEDFHSTKDVLALIKEAEMKAERNKAKANKMNKRRNTEKDLGDDDANKTRIDGNSVVDTQLKSKLDNKLQSSNVVKNRSNEEVDKNKENKQRRIHRPLATNLKTIPKVTDNKTNRVTKFASGAVTDDSDLESNSCSKPTLSGKINKRRQTISFERQPVKSKLKPPKPSTNKKRHPSQATTVSPAGARRKRMASDMLYYWSSSDDEEFGRIKPREEYDDDNLEQHGWIVGDSHKKLVTLLAHAKGKKIEDCGVKETSHKKK